MADIGTTDRQPFLVRCGDCQHVWPVGYLPMEAMAFARLMKGAHCPMCAAPPRRIFCAAAGEAPGGA